MPFTQQELEDAYEQMVKERLADYALAKLASDKLGKLIGQVCFLSSQKAWGYSCSWNPINPWANASPHTVEYELFYTLCQYDNWHAHYNTLTQYCTMQPWNGNYGNPASLPKGTFDLSNEPDFLNAKQKVFPVTITFEDSHIGGY